MKRRRQIIALMAGALALLVAAGAQAATVGIQTLAVSDVSGTFTIPGILSYPVDQPLSPPMVLTMGTYAGSLVNYSSSGVTVTLDSTSAYGGAPLSGSVDTGTGVLSLDLSSLYATVNDPTYGISASGDVWTPSSTITQNSYNSGTGAFAYGWSDTFDATTPLGQATVNYNVLMQGTATVSAVPVPASVVLMLSGLLPLGWCARRKRS